MLRSDISLQGACEPPDVSDERSRGELWIVASTSFASQHCGIYRAKSQAIMCSTIQRRGKTSKPYTVLERLMISIQRPIATKAAPA